MDPSKRHRLCWQAAYALLRRPIEKIFRLSHENTAPRGPCLIISNHVTDYDPLLLAMSFPRTDLYFVASEHLFRKGLVSRLLLWTMAPISRRKGSQGTDTVKACLRHLKEGHAVCIFAEGDATWDGRSSQVFPATGKLARASGASLMTYRLEGGYLTRPRWSRTLRRGKLFGHPVAVYTPEQLRAMRADEITAVINRDIYEDAWARQREQRVPFRGKRLAERLELALFFCPHCRQIGTLRSEGDRLFCSCGMTVRYKEDGFFDPPVPFETVAEWEDWQEQKLRELPTQAGEALFFDDDVRLSRVEAGHRDELLAVGRLAQYPEGLHHGNRVFPLDKVGNMAMVQKHLLLFSFDGQYYELLSKNGVNFRKYLSWWKDYLVRQE